MFKILGDKLPAKALNQKNFIKKNMAARKSEVQKAAGPSIDFDALLFAKSDIKMVKLIYAHSFFSNCFRLLPFRLSGCFLNGIVHVISFFKSKSTRDMKRHLESVGLIFSFLRPQVDMFDFFIKFHQKMQKFLEFVETRSEEKSEELTTEYFESICGYKDG